MADTAEGAAASKDTPQYAADAVRSEATGEH
jgi:hypothetical protein